MLYPDDTTDQGKALRLKQEYFFTAASLRDIIRRFEPSMPTCASSASRAPRSSSTTPTRPSPGRNSCGILHDERGIDFDDATEIARRTLNYTNHTLLPEALETWSEGLMGWLLPRHLQIIGRIDDAHGRAYPSRPVRILDRGNVNMGPLSFIMANRVNGVSALHTDLMKSTVFSELHALHPERIVNQTNGVTPRRWVQGCNPRLAALITDTIGEAGSATPKSCRISNPMWRRRLSRGGHGCETCQQG